MRFVRQGYSEYLKDIIDTPFESHIVLHYCYKAVSYYGTIYLDADGILGCAPELLYPQVLFYPFEKLMESFP